MGGRPEGGLSVATGDDNRTGAGLAVCLASRSAGRKTYRPADLLAVQAISSYTNIKARGFSIRDLSGVARSQLSRSDDTCYWALSRGH